MSDISRFGVSMDEDLLERFDRLCKRRKYQNRSEALRDLVRDAMVREEWQSDEEIVGTITLIYDHHTRELSDSLTQAQHDHFDAILSNLHVHLDHDNCLEVIAVRGKASLVQKVADALISKRGVKHGKLSATTTGKRLK
jgi:CopG family transcriptional regulator, nickel-responsive regulator